MSFYSRSLGSAVLVVSLEPTRYLVAILGDSAPTSDVILSACSPLLQWRKTGGPLPPGWKADI
jgi:hypothetical protein